MKSCLWAAACGVLLALSFPTFNQAALAWIAPGLILFYAARSQKPFWIGFCAGLTHYFISLNWLLNNPIRLYGISSWLSVSGILAGFVACWCWLCCRIAPKSLGKNKFSLPSMLWPLFCAALWVAMEMTIARFLTGFPWNLLGASQHQFLPLIQIASVTGIYGVSFMVVWFSSAMVFGPISIRSEEQTVRLRFVPLILPVSIFALVLLFGWRQLSIRHSPDGQVTFALIQPAIPQTVIWDASQESNRFHQIIELSKEALEKTHPEILVWPEAAMPRMMSRLNKDAVAGITQLATTYKTWIVLGATDIGLIRSKDGVIQETNLLNSAFLVDPKGDLVRRYFKRQLVPVGEYMPLNQWFPKLESLRKSGRSLTPGRNQMIFDLRRPDGSRLARISPTICFEDVFPHVVRLREDEKADLILNLTNDGWFGEGSAQWQQAASATFRAIENGLPLVRCANNGISCWIDERGRWHETHFEDGRSVYSSGFKRVQINLQPTLADQPTIYRRFGDWFGWSCFGLALLFGGMLRKQRSAQT